MSVDLPMPRVGPLAEHAPKPIRVVLNWGRRYSLWVFNFGLAPCYNSIPPRAGSEVFFVLEKTGV